MNLPRFRLFSVGVWTPTDARFSVDKAAPMLVGTVREIGSGEWCTVAPPTSVSGVSDGAGSSAVTTFLGRFNPTLLTEEIPISDACPPYWAHDGGQRLQIHDRTRCNSTTTRIAKP